MILVGTAVVGVATWAARLGWSVRKAALVDLAVFVLGLSFMLIHCAMVLGESHRRKWLALCSVVFS